MIDTGVDINHPDLAQNLWTNAAEAQGTTGVDDDGNGPIDDLHGWNVIEHNGDLISGNIDLILLDMTIPGARSSEVVAEAGKVRPDIKVVLTSAYSQEMIAGAMNAPQIRGFIRKPFQLGDLVKKLKNTLVMG